MGKEILKIGKTDVTQILQRKFLQLKDNWICLLCVPVEYSMKVNIESIKILQHLGYDGIYISLFTPACELIDIFKKNEIYIQRLKIIDGISQMYGSKEIEGVEYVIGPIAVDTICSLVFKILPELKSKRKFVFLDSITIVLLYNSLERTVQFSNFLSHTLKNKNVLGIMLSVSRGFINEKLLKELEKISDEIINLDKELHEKNGK